MIGGDAMVTLQTFLDRADEVEHMIHWWVSQSRYRLYEIRRVGTINDFIQEVWANLLHSFQVDPELPFAFSTVVVNQCLFTLRKFAPASKGRRHLLYRLYNAKPVEADDLVTDREFAEERVTLQELEAVTADVLCTLKEREAVILRARLGLSGAEEQTAKQLATTLGVCKQRVHQLENQAFAKLSEPPCVDKLKPFLPLCYEWRKRAEEERDRKIYEEWNREQIEHNSKIARRLQSTEYGAVLLDHLLEDSDSGD